MSQLMVGQTGVCVHCNEKITVAATLDAKGRINGARLEALVPADRYATHCINSPIGHSFPITKS